MKLNLATDDEGEDEEEDEEEVDDDDDDGNHVLHGTKKNNIGWSTNLHSILHIFYVHQAYYVLLTIY